jgi:uncharacterized Zn-finger protein
MTATLRQAVHTWYILSCSHVAHHLVKARGNTMHCYPCEAANQWPRVFILETCYDKPIDPD